MNKSLLLTVLLWVFGCAVYAQGLSVNADGAAPHSSAMLDVASTSKGVLIPRVALTGTDDITTVPSPAASLLIYNSASAGSGATAVLPGFYFWNGAAWVRVTAQSDLSSSVWTLNGNGGTTAANFIGTTDNKPLVFKVNNTLSGQLSSGANTSWGYGALSANPTGNYNTASGYSALSGNTTGHYNTANGSMALYYNTTGFLNTASGSWALYSNTEGAANTASGSMALYNNTSGGGNAASGFQALYYNTTGGDNTASGAQALYSNTEGIDNTASGAQALYSNNTGVGNTGSGGYALYSNTAGFFNTASGLNALYSNTTGYFNAASGGYALSGNTTGEGNTASGYGALVSNTTGSHNTALGFEADVLGSLQNATAIGAWAMVGRSNALVLGSIAGVNEATSSVNVGIGTTTPHASAVLDLTSTVRGVLIPRMTAAQRGAIASPATGLLVYQTDAPAGFYYRGSAEWTKVTDGSELGSLSSSVWKLGGNAGTTDENFIGTTDDRPLVFKVNNTLAGWISANWANTSWGKQALLNNTTGYENTASGFEALKSNTTGYWNTASGSTALTSNTTGFNNTATGAYALYDNTGGSFNTASGLSALTYNTLGSRNAANGSRALVYNTTGSYNTANGMDALFNNTTGSYNTALGYGAGVLGNNLTNATALGARAQVGSDNALVLGSINGVGGATSSVNVGIGTTTPHASAALEVTSTERGVLVPRVVLTGTNDLTTIANPATSLLVYNTATAGSGTTTVLPGFYYWNGSAWTRVITRSDLSSSVWTLGGNSGTTADNFIGTTDNQPLVFRVNNTVAGKLYGGNASWGILALAGNITGNYNSANGFSALASNTQGLFNTASGAMALYNNISGYGNTALGASADVSSGDLTNATAIGAHASVNASNKVRIGDGAVTVIEGAVGFSYPSDGRYKYNIQEDVHGLDFILKLRPITYQFDVQRLDGALHPAGVRTAGFNASGDAYRDAAALRRSGFIAQEVEQAANAVGYNFSGLNKPKTANDHYGLSYESFVVPLVKAVQEQQQQIKELRQEMESLKKENEQLKQLNEQVEQLSQSVRALSTPLQKQ